MKPRCSHCSTNSSLKSRRYISVRVDSKRELLKTYKYNSERCGGSGYEEGVHYFQEGRGCSQCYSQIPRTWNGRSETPPFLCPSALYPVMIYSRQCLVHYDAIIMFVVDTLFLISTFDVFSYSGARCVGPGLIICSCKIALECSRMFDSVSW